MLSLTKHLIYKNLTLRESANISPQDSGPLWRAGEHQMLVGPTLQAAVLCCVPFWKGNAAAHATPTAAVSVFLPKAQAALLASGRPGPQRPAQGGGPRGRTSLPWPRRGVWTNIQLFAARWPFPWSLIMAAGVVLGLKDLLWPLPCTRAGPPCHHLGQGWCNRSGSTQSCVPAPTFIISV